MRTGNIPASLYLGTFILTGKVFTICCSINFVREEAFGGETKDLLVNQCGIILLNPILRAYNMPAIAPKIL